MIREARQRCRKEESEGRAEFRPGGLELLRPEDGPFDGAWMVNVAQFLPSRAEAFATIGRALRPGGRLAVTHQPRPAGAQAIDAEKFAAKVREEMSSAGFRDISQHTLPLVPAPAVCVIGFIPIQERHG